MFCHIQIQLELFSFQFSISILHCSEGDVKKLLLASNVCNSAVQLLRCPPNVYIHLTFWGTGIGQIDTKSTHKGGRVNEDFIPASVQSSALKKLRESISSTWNDIHGTNGTSSKYQVIMLFVWGNKIENKIIAHCNVLIVAKEEDKFTCNKRFPIPRRNDNIY